MPTINDIAKKLGVSKSTVSKAFHDADDISETLRKKILETAVAMGYKKNRIRKNDPRKLCVLVEHLDWKDPAGFGHDVVLGFEQAAVLDGWEVEIPEISKEFQTQISYDAFMLSRSFQGAFALGFSLSDPWMEDFKTAGTPAVLHDNYIPQNPFVTYVGVNSEEGFDLAVSHLNRLGHTRIGYLGGDANSFIVRARFQAYLRAMERCKLPADQNLIGRSCFISECTSRHLPRLLKNGATAILCEHDQLANAVLVHCMELGVHVPKDVSIVGFDDTAFASCTTPPLTCIRQDQNALGRCGYYALTSLLHHTYISSLLLRAELIERRSTGPVWPGP